MLSMEGTELHLQPFLLYFLNNKYIINFVTSSQKKIYEKYNSSQTIKLGKSGKLH
jgi:hypothetical protein